MGPGPGWVVAVAYGLSPTLCRSHVAGNCPRVSAGLRHLLVRLPGQGGNAAAGRRVVGTWGAAPRQGG